MRGSVFIATSSFDGFIARREGGIIPILEDHLAARPEQAGGDRA